MFLNQYFGQFFYQLPRALARGQAIQSWQGFSLTKEKDVKIALAKADWQVLFDFG